MPRTPQRRITKAKITTISLVPRGANQMPVIYKSDDDVAEFGTIVKDDRLDEHGELTAIVYAPEQTDSQGDIASAAVIKDMAYDFAQRGLGDIDLRHDGKPVSKNDAYVAESFIVQKGDPRFDGTKDYDGNKVDVAGAWATVIKIEDKGLRTLYREGKWNGVSMFGNATVKAASEDNQVLELLKGLGRLVGVGARDSTTTSNGDLDMDAKELNQILDKRDDSIVAKLTKALSTTKHDADTLSKAGVEDDDTPEVIDLKVELYKAKNPNGTKPVTKSDDNDKTTKPKFDGDPTDEKAVAKFEFEVKKHEILSEMDATDPASVKEANEKLTALTKEAGDSANGDDGDTPEVADLKRRLRKAEGRSNQPSDKSRPTGMSKEDAEAAEIGAQVAAYANNDTEAIAKIEKGERVA